LANRKIKTTMSLLPTETTSVLTKEDEKQQSETLALASKAWNNGDMQRALEYAKTVLTTMDDRNESAHQLVCRALFQLRRYAECERACQNMPTTLEYRKRLGIGRLREKCQLLKNLSSHHHDNNRPTDKLHKEWYRNQIQAWILHQEGALQQQVLGGGPNDCAVIQLDDGRTDWTQEGDYHNDGCICRQDLRANLLFEGFPLDQATGGVVYTKNQIVAFNCSKDYFPFEPNSSSYRREPCYQGNGRCLRCARRQFPYPLHSFPDWPVSVDPERKTLVESPNAELDVHYGKDLVSTQTKAILRAQLDRLPFTVPAPMYENRIDPNMNTLNGTWIPTDFEVSDHITPRTDVVVALELVCTVKIGSPLPFGLAREIAMMAGQSDRLAQVRMVSRLSPDLDPHDTATLHLAVQQVLQDAMPLLAKLKRPSLLLPGPLQCVVKAQRIILKGDNNEYEGIWHDDGLREHVVAVVLYYYRKSPNIKGGNLELCTKRTVQIGKHDADTGFVVDDYARELPRSIIPVEEGSLVVLSNYSSVHRVLRMVREPGEEDGCRDFLAFFVIDQRHPLQRPSPENTTESLQTRKETASELLQEQLVPRSTFGVDCTVVYSTGNGCVADVGWVSNASERDDDENGRDFGTEIDTVSRFNAPPPVLGRGLSYLASLEFAAKYNASSSWAQYDIQGDDGLDSVIIFVDWSTWECTADAPDDGVHGFRSFDSRRLWAEFAAKEGIWSHDAEISFIIESC